MLIIHSSQPAIDSYKQLLKRIAAGQSHYYAPHCDSHLGADLEQFQANRSALRLFHLGSSQTQSPHQTVGHQMIVLDQLPLLIAVVFGQQSSAERHPLGEAIEILTLVKANWS